MLRNPLIFHTKSEVKQKPVFVFFMMAPKPNKKTILYFPTLEKTIGIVQYGLPCVKGGGTAQP